MLMLMLMLKVTNVIKHAASLPASFITHQLSGPMLMAHASVDVALRDAVTRCGTLYDWARSEPQSRALRGRAPVYVARANGVPLAVRHAWHGGVFAPLTRDVYRLPTRAPRELRMSQLLHDAGIPTTEVLAYALYPVLPGMVRYDVATRYVPDAYDFAAVLAGLAPDIARAPAIVAVAVLVARLSHHRFVHPDLNVKNILLHRPLEQLVAMVVDVDVMQHDVRTPRPQALVKNRTRLTRSLRKARVQFVTTMEDAEIAQVGTLAEICCAKLAAQEEGTQSRGDEPVVRST